MLSWRLFKDTHQWTDAPYNSIEDSMDTPGHLLYLDAKQQSELRKSSNSCIYKVPKKLRVPGGDRYDPHIVSIGPYHHAAEHLEVTNLKKHYVRCFIEDSITPHTILKHLVNGIKEVHVDARLYYANSFDMNESEFKDMLLLDGCFIIGVLCRHQVENDHKRRVDDILFNNKSILSSVRRDLILLENQIPYCVLDVLFKLITRLRPQKNSEISTLKQYIMDFFSPILPATILETQESRMIEDKHILDILREHLIPVDQREPDVVEEIRVEIDSNELWEHTTCATDLQEAGVKFRRKDTNGGLLDISFREGKFEIPPFYFGESWTVLFPNMIALEQCRGDYKDLITSYVRLMDNLVDTSSDVKLLKDQEIITGSPQEYETIANNINHLSKEALYETFYYDDMCRDVNRYRKRRWPGWRATFMRNYVHTPWTGISLIAAALLLLLAVAQTVISALSWKLK